MSAIQANDRFSFVPTCFVHSLYFVLPAPAEALSPGLLSFLEDRDLGREIFGEDHPEVLKSISNLAGLLQQRGCFARTKRSRMSFTRPSHVPPFPSIPPKP